MAVKRKDASLNKILTRDSQIILETQKIMGKSIIIIIIIIIIVIIITQ